MIVVLIFFLGVVIGLNLLAKEIRPLLDEQIVQIIDELQWKRRERLQLGLPTSMQDEAIKRFRRVQTHGYWPE